MFFAVVRFSPPSPKAEAVKRKAEAKNNSPDLQEPTFNLLVAAERSEAALGEFVVNLKKQSQFSKSQNERKYLYERAL